MTRETKPNRFEQAASDRAAKSPSAIGELLQFVRANKRWWMIPLIVLLLVFGLLVFLSGTAAAPFVYTLF